MLKSSALIGVATLLATSGPAAAADVSLGVVDGDGRPVKDAVVRLVPQRPVAAEPDDPADQHIIDQRNETFIPLVTLVRRGGQVVFRNSDTVRHHVYSFAAIKQFEMLLSPGDQAAPIRFDKSGVVAIGCNIHDRMIAYVYVTDTRWAALTDAGGRAFFSGVPPGPYLASVWHPLLPPGTEEPSRTVAIGEAPAAIALTVPLVPDWKSRFGHDRRY